VVESEGTPLRRPHLARRWKPLLGAALALASLALAGAALPAASYGDRAGDDNAAPDVTAVKLSEAAGVLAMSVSVANFQMLPAESWVNVWFDLDSNPATGAEGDEALVRYLADGSLSLYVWDGAGLAERPAAGLTGSFAAGTLTLSVPKGDLGATAPSFGVLVVTARGQRIGPQELVAADFLPEDGRSAYSGPDEATFSDAAGDHDAAPDITAIRVVDGKDGWIRFALTTPNYAALRADSLLGLFVDTDNRASTGEAGAEVRVSVFGGEFQLERWRPATGRWALDGEGTRVRIGSGGNVVRLDVHRSELGAGPRFGFALVTGEINVATESLVAVDFAPEGDGYFRYTLANRPAVTLSAGRPSSVPARPHAGERVIVSARVTRSDTGAAVTSGRVSCRVTADGDAVRSTGRFVERRATCGFVVPQDARLIRGVLTVRSAGAVVRVPFSVRAR